MNDHIEKEPAHLELLGELDDRELLELAVEHERVELRAEHGGDVELPVGEHDAESLVALVGRVAVFALERA